MFLSIRTPRHTIYINEVLLLITEYFLSYEAVAPSLVCRSWNLIFIRAIWRCLTLTSFHTLPSLELIKRSAHCIRQLTYSGDLSLDYYDLPCTRLTTIKLIVYPQINPRAWNFLSILILRNKDLQDLYLSDPPCTTSPLLWSTLSRCSNLKSLIIDEVKVDSSDINNFWNGSIGLHVLFVMSLEVSGSPTQGFFDRNLGIFPNMEYLRFNFKDDSQVLDQSQLLRRCPNLRRYNFGPEESRTMTVRGLAKILEEGGLSCLAYLQIEIDCEDKELSLCLQAMQEIRRLTVTQGDFGRRSFASLVPHFNSLWSLLLKCCFRVTGAMVQRILESCPLLTNLSAPRIEVSRIIRGKRWLCLNLKSFDVCIILDSKDLSIGVQSRMVYVQLARLTKLEYLYIAADTGTEIQGLDLRLASGLYQLPQKLRGLRYAGTIQNIAFEDVEWMRKHWELKSYPIPQHMHV